MKKADKWLTYFLVLLAGLCLALVVAVICILANEVAESEEISIFEKIEEVREAEPAEEVNGGVVELTHDVQLMVQEDRDLVMRVASAEGANQGEDGMWLIMSVIMNRVADPEYPDSVREVIYEDNAFTSIKNKSADKAEPTEACEMAMVRIEEGDIAPKIIGFERIDSNKLTKYFDWAFDYKDHSFYVKKATKK